MNLRHLRMRILPSLIAVLAGWVTAVVATLPMQIAKIVGNTFGGPGALLLALSEGMLIWGAWSLALAAGGWLLVLLPVVLLIPEDWLLRRPRISISLVALFAWIAVMVEFKLWKLLLPDSSLAVRMFTLYSLLLVVYAAVSAFVYLRLLAPKVGGL